MTKGRRLLLPWYRYPPFRKEGIGGLSVAVWELTKELAGQGVHVDVLTAPPRGREENKDYPPGLSVSNSSLGEKFFKNELLKEGESRFLDSYDAILSVANYGARTLRSSDRAFDRVTRQIHTIGHDRNLDSYVSLRPDILEYFRMFVAKRKEEKNEKFLFGSKCICISCYLLRKMCDNNLEASDNLFWIPNGIQTRLFQPMENEKIYDLLFVGRFQKAKGLDLLLSALRLIQITKGDVYKFAVAGEFTAEQRSFIGKTVPAAVAERIVFLGTVQRGDMPKVINSTKLVVVPSRYESFGLPALEAIACGVPVLATKVGGLPEIIDETVGLLVDPGKQALARGIYTSIKDTSLAERAAFNGPERAERYDWRIIAPRIIRTLFLT